MERQYRGVRAVGECHGGAYVAPHGWRGRMPGALGKAAAGALMAFCAAAQAQASAPATPAQAAQPAGGREGLTALLPALPQVGGRPDIAIAGAPQAQACLIEPFQVSEIGSASPGIVEAIEVHRGDVVAAGQTLAVLNTQVDEATLKLRQAEAAYLARVTGRNAELYKRKLLPAGDYDELTSRSRQAQLQVALQQAILAERKIKSPYAGVVAERYVGQGDRVNDNKLLRLAQIDPLLVKVVVPESAYGRIRQGDTAAVSLNPAIRADALNAEVWRIDRVMDAASGTFTVLLKMANPDHAIPAGVRCTIRFAAPAAAGS